MQPLPDLQKINVKFGIDAPADADWDSLLNIFSRWRLEEGEEILDLADYSHVPEAPSLILVSKRWQLGVDFARGTGEEREGEWAGLFYASRKGLEGNLGETLRSVIASALEKFQRLAGEKEFPQGVTILCGELDIAFNDRLLLPNTDEADSFVRPHVEETLTGLYGEGAFELERETDPGRRLAYCARATAQDLDPASALKKLY
jgi:hypothetical protein